jgi:tRNA pseudouridine55 synthase
MEKHVTIEKEVGQTPLQALEAYRAKHPELLGMPMAYAGRLDPMASGKLLILLGEECKQQEKYHSLDKEYEFSVLFGIESDTGDVLGRLASGKPPRVPEIKLYEIAHDLLGEISFSYPRFSSKTVKGKPLHVWTLEDRLNEIEIPSYTATIHSLSLVDLTSKTCTQIADEALTKIETIPEVTEESKALGRNFRRDEVRKDWHNFKEQFGNVRYPIATFKCVCSSGLYMRTLAEEIADRAGTKGLAWSIDRTKIGEYLPILKWGFWKKQF